MSYINKGKKFLNVLSKTGYYTKDHQGQSFDWLFDVGETFMEWFCEYIDSSNILEPEELLELEEFSDKGIHGENLDTALMPLKLNEGDLQVEEREIVFLKQELGEADDVVYDELGKELRLECQEMITAVYQLREQWKDAEARLLEAKEDCCELGNRLDSQRHMVAQHQDDISATLTNYKNTALETHLIAQLSLDKYKEQCDIFNMHLSNYISRQFYEINLRSCHDKNESVSNENGSNLLLVKGQGQKALVQVVEELNHLQHSISFELYGNILECVEGKYLVSSLQYAQELKHVDPQDIYRCEEVVSTLPMDSLDLMDKIQHLCRLNAEWEILMRVVSQECHFKTCRQQYWVQKLCGLSKCIENQMKHSGTLRMLINAERRLAINMTDITCTFQQTLIDEYENFIARKAALKMAKENYVAYKNNTAAFHTLLAECIYKLMTCDEKPLHVTWSNLNAALVTVGQDIDTKEQNLFATALQNTKEVLQKKEKSIKELERFVFSGPTKKLINYSSSFSIYNNAELIIDAFEKTLEEYIAQKENMLLELERQPFTKNKRVLWIYFLVDCEKLNSVAADLETALDRKLSMGLCEVAIPGRDGTCGFAVSTPK